MGPRISPAVQDRLLTMAAQIADRALIRNCTPEEYIRLAPVVEAEWNRRRRQLMRKRRAK